MSGRRLDEGEKALWASLAETVTPLTPSRRIPLASAPTSPGTADQSAHPRLVKGRVPPPRAQTSANPGPGVEKQLGASLDSHWERRFRRAAVAPDFTLDLHGATLDQAYRRLDRGLHQAKAMRARVVLVITGKPRPVEAADRGSRRGAIRAKITDWLASGPHASDIAGVRAAHRRHGGEGALYLVLKRAR